MGKMWWLAVFAGLGLVLPAGAETPAPPPSPTPSIEQLIQLLGSTNYLKRDEATRAIEGMGTAALPALRKAQNHPDPEVRRRLDDLIPMLETAAILAPPPVNLKAENRPLKEVLEELGKQTGHKVEVWGGNQADNYTGEFKSATFWEAIDSICEEKGLVLQQGYGDDRVRLHAQDSFTPHVYRQGIFRFVANSFQYNRSIDFSTARRMPTAPNRSEVLNFTFTVFSEPRLPLLAIGEVDVAEAYDDQKISMVPPPEGDPSQGGARRYYRGYSGYKSFSQQTQVNLVRGSDRSRTLKYIRGTVGVTLLAEQKRMAVSEEIMKAKGKKVKLGPTTISVDDVTETPAKQIQIRLTISEDGRGGDYTWMNSLYQRLELEDAKGNKFQSYGTSFSSSGPGTAQITFTYAKNGNVGEPAKLHFHVWNTLQHEVAFEFHDLPLP